MNTVILVSIIASSYFNGNYILDLDIYKGILSIIAFGSLGFLAIHPMLLFQMLNTRNLTKRYDIRPLFLSFYISITSNMFVFGASIYLMARVNIMSDSSLIVSAIVLIGHFMSIVFLNLITKVDLIKKSLLIDD